MQAVAIVEVARHGQALPGQVLLQRWGAGVEAVDGELFAQQDYGGVTDGAGLLADRRERGSMASRPPNW
ncbi:hypothetical protein OK015_24655 [Mycobacterium sp. Aquia_216]|uniref:hypothetical protein n=1 Tax=Mycobacterium sp. Aquia_216 TaxID=2991729 RepID=UPI00227A32C9|nr:hypothetical protein [Mycobacterium sp. Aquia_216]WAJ44291.1 hypothetical protein OK015_24655 [Mycobacterium sp. Aquia_216]